MKKIRIFVMLLVFIFTLSANAFAVESEINIPIETANDSIAKLIQERQMILADKSFDNDKLNAVDAQLEDLGAEFLTNQEVSEMFPEAYASVCELQKPDVSIMGTSAVLSASDMDDILTWIRYEGSTFTHGAHTYEIIHLIAQPLSDRCRLWKEGSATKSTGLPWFSASSNFFNVKTQLTGQEDINSYFTLYESLSDVWLDLQQESQVHMSSIDFDWTCITNVCFSDSKIAGTDDYDGMHIAIGTECYTTIDFRVNVDSWMMFNGMNTPLQASYYENSISFHNRHDAFMNDMLVRNGTVFYYELDVNFRPLSGYVDNIMLNCPVNSLAFEIQPVQPNILTPIDYPVY